MKRSKFSLSYDRSVSLNQGMLNPIGLTEVLPGDSIQQATQALIRMAPLNAPIMHPTHAKIMHFFVPHRLVWDEWEDFITRGPDGDSAPIFPTIEFDSIAAGSLANLLGLPVFTTAEDVAVSALPFRGYNLIYNEYFRDQDLIDPVAIDLTSGSDTTTNIALLAAAWEKDYFTSARLFTQKGPEITIPIIGDAPVFGTGKNLGLFDGTNKVGMSSNASPVMNATTGTYGTAPGDAPGGTALAASKGLGVVTKAQAGATPSDSGLFADMSEIAGIDVNELRLALSLQRFEEARARWGSRYVEYLRYLGVKSSDARLQRPEYLGGGKQTIQFSEVLQTGVTTGGSTGGVGNMKGHGIAALSSNRYRRFFEEHGYIFSFLVVRPKAIYANGIPKHWTYRTYVDLWQKELEHIGQQEIMNKEVYVDSAAPDAVFGYNDRYDQYRRSESSVAGEFATTLNYWTQARIFSSEPDLNADFVNCIPSPRIFQSTTTDQMYVMARHSIQARRLVAKTGSSYIF